MPVKGSLPHAESACLVMDWMPAVVEVTVVVVIIIVLIVLVSYYLSEIIKSN